MTDRKNTITLHQTIEELRVACERLKEVKGENLGLPLLVYITSYEFDDQKNIWQDIVGVFCRTVYDAAGFDAQKVEIEAEVLASWAEVVSNCLKSALARPIAGEEFQVSQEICEEMAARLTEKILKDTLEAYNAAAQEADASAAALDAGAIAERIGESKDGAVSTTGIDGEVDSAGSDADGKLG